MHNESDMLNKHLLYAAELYIEQVNQIDEHVHRQSSNESTNEIHCQEYSHRHLARKEISQ